MRIISEGLERPAVCQPSIDRTTEMGHDAKSRRFCPDAGANCAILRKRLLGAIPLSEATEATYIACANGQIDAPLDISHQTPEF